MVQGRRDHTKHAKLSRSSLWTLIFGALFQGETNKLRQKWRTRPSFLLLLGATKPDSSRRREKLLYARHVKQIVSRFEHLFYTNELICIGRSLYALTRTRTEQSRYCLGCHGKSDKTNLVWKVFSFIFYRRTTTLHISMHVESSSQHVSGHAAQMRKIFCELMHRRWRALENFFTYAIQRKSFSNRALYVSQACNNKLTILRCLNGPYRTRQTL